MRAPSRDQPKPITALFFIAHDLNVVHYVADHVAVIYTAKLIAITEPQGGLQPSPIAPAFDTWQCIPIGSHQ